MTSKRYTERTIKTAAKDQEVNLLRWHSGQKTSIRTTAQYQITEERQTDQKQHFAKVFLVLKSYFYVEI